MVSISNPVSQFIRIFIPCQDELPPEAKHVKIYIEIRLHAYIYCNLRKSFTFHLEIMQQVNLVSVGGIFYICISSLHHHPAAMQ